MQVYIHPIVAEINLFYGSILTDYNGYPNVSQHLNAIAHKLWEGIQKGEFALYTEVNNYHPQYLGVSPQELQNKKLTKEDCYITIASEYGFTNWNEVEDLGSTSYDKLFERTINDLLSGKIARVKRAIEMDKELITKRSPYGHNATLLHYVASNGVELWRQYVPENLPEITHFLVDSGADPSARMKVYGGEYDVLSLLQTSAHPKEAGIMEEMMIALR